jgi:hypothetical protein
LPGIYYNKSIYLYLLLKAVYITDAAFGVLAFLPNLIKRYGWNPGERLHGHVEKVISRRSGIDMITFKQVKKRPMKGSN